MAHIWRGLWSPIAIAGAWWLFNVLAMTCSVIAADFGMAWWLLPLVVVWAFTLGLPILVTLVASLLIFNLLVPYLPSVSLLTFGLFFGALSLAAHRAAVGLAISVGRLWGAQ